jgi:D-amino peptidase
MRVVITSDLEGVTGVDDYRMVVRANQDLYHQACVNLTEDINAAVRGLKRAGVDEILVIDGHGGGKPPNILDDQLEGGARVIREGSPYDVFTQELDAGLMIGAHAMAGTRDGFMSHTTSGMTSMVVHGQPIGETEKIGWLGEYHGVPQVMVTGDAALVREVAHFFPGIDAVAVKRASGRAFAESVNRAEASERIAEAAFRAVRRRADREPYIVPAPVVLEIVLATVKQASRAALLPRTERIGERRLRYVADDYPEAVKAFNVALRLAGMTRTEHLLETLEERDEVKEMRDEWRRGVVERWIHDEPPFEDPVAAWS